VLKPAKVVKKKADAPKKVEEDSDADLGDDE
jgi:hypothetical protein